MNDLGCYQALKEYLGFELTQREICKMLGPRWSVDDIVNLIGRYYRFKEIDVPAQYGDIIFSGKHLMLYDGAGMLWHYCRGRKVETRLKMIKVDRVIRVTGGIL